MRQLSRTLWRVLALALAFVLLAAGSCNNDKDDAVETAEPTIAPTPGLDAVADFQLVGLIDEAFAGQAPPVEIPSGVVNTPDPSASPAGTPVGDTPTRGGIIRLSIEDLNTDLAEACDLAADDVVHIYWTTETAFDPGSVLDDVEDEIEGSTAGIVGTVYTQGTGTAAATASPVATGLPESSDCLLVAEQIGFTGSALPTPRAARRTSTPAPTATASATPKATSTPTASPTAAPTATASTSPSPTT